MSRQDSEKAPVTFCDVVASFSVEEWRLLHDWQKELYKNVMNEIQKALISLGPLIAASVFSLSTEKEVVLPVDNAGPEACSSVNHPPGDLNFESHQPSEFTNDRTHCLQEQPNVCQWESSKSTSRVEHKDNAPIPSFTIKEEAETECLDQLDIQVVERPMSPAALEACHVVNPGTEVDDNSNSITTGNHHESSLISQNHNSQKISHCQEEYEYGKITPESGASIKNEGGNTLKHDIIQPSGTSQEIKRVLQRSETRMSTGRQLQSKVYPLLDGEDIMECQSGIGESTFSISYHQGIPKVAISAECNDSQNVFGNPKHLSSRQTSNAIKAWHMCAECEKGFSKRSNLLRHQKRHTEERYRCSSCKLNFSRHEHLVAHKRIHERERPYECTECEKRFPHKYRLALHERTHTGEKPYQCNVCRRSFNQASHLITHKRTHTGEKPYQCPKCKQSFGQKGTLIRHENAHACCNQKKARRGYSHQDDRPGIH